MRNGWAAMAILAVLACVHRAPTDTLLEHTPNTGPTSELQQSVRRNDWIRVLEQAALIPGTASAGLNLEFLQGVAYFELGRWNEAALHLNAVIESDPLLRDYALNLLASLREKQGSDTEAALLWDALRTREPKSRFAQTARIAHARTLLRSGNAQAALHELNKIPLHPRRKKRRQRLQRASSTGEVDLLKAQASLALGRTHEAQSALQTLVLEDCGSEASRAAQRALVALKSTDATLLDHPWSKQALELSWTEAHWPRLAETLSKCGMHEQAYDIHQNLLAKNPSSRALRLDIAQDLYGMRRNPEALQAYQALLQERREAECLYGAAQACVRVGDLAQARIHYEEFRKSFPQHSLADDALFRLGFLLMGQGEYKSAEEVLHQVVRRYPRSDRSADARWALGWCQFKSELYAESRKTWEEAAQHRRHTRRRRQGPVSTDRYDYWIGRSLQREGKVDQARARFQKILGENAFHYYGYLAALRLRQLDPAMPLILPPKLTPRPTFTFDSTSWAEHAEPSAQKAVALAALGLDQWASDELSTLQSRMRKQDEFLALARTYRALSDYHRSSYIARVNFQSDLAHPAVESEQDATRELWALAYPEAWAPLVAPHAQRLLVPPSLVWGIMRQESSFRPEARSKARAYGLMQIIEPTASAVAGRAVTPEEILDVPKNIEWGVQYIADLWVLFKGRVDYVAGAYNAGPDRVQEWLRDRGNVPADEFIEAIPFGETREYVKKVLAMVVDYEQLYGSEMTSDRILQTYFIPLPVDEPRNALQPSPERVPFSAIPLSNATGDPKADPHANAESPH